jgi:hypothetical protein
MITQFSKLILVCTFFISSCGTVLKVPIERGKIDGDFTIQFTDKNITLRPNEFFKLSELGLIANGGEIKRKTVNSTDIKSALKLFKKQRIRNYPITIVNPHYKKPYYGKIAFFNTNKVNEAEAVSRYYEIDIDGSYFDNATRGRMAIVYEYSNVRASLVKDVKVPTWIILLSDEPF